MLNLIFVGAIAAASIPDGVPFDTPTIKQAQDSYEAANKLYVSKANPDFNSFADLLAEGWLQAHKEEALAKAAKRGLPQAAPEDAWELPYANLWVGCMSFELGGGTPFAKYHFHTIEDAHTLGNWLKSNAAILHADDAGLLFERQLQNLTAIAAKCEDTVRGAPKTAERVPTSTFIERLKRIEARSNEIDSWPLEERLGAQKIILKEIREDLNAP